MLALTRKCFTTTQQIYTDSVGMFEGAITAEEFKISAKRIGAVSAPDGSVHQQPGHNNGQAEGTRCHLLQGHGSREGLQPLADGSQFRDPRPNDGIEETTNDAIHCRETESTLNGRTQEVLFRSGS